MSSLEPSLIFQFYRLPDDSTARLGTGNIHQMPDFDVVEKGGAVSDAVTTETGYGRDVYRHTEDGDVLAWCYVVNGFLQFGTGIA